MEKEIDSDRSSVQLSHCSQTPSMRRTAARLWLQQWSGPSKDDESEQINQKIYENSDDGYPKRMSWNRGIPKVNEMTSNDIWHLASIFA